MKKGKRKIAKRFVKVFVFFIFIFFKNFVGKAKIKPVDKEFYYLIHCLVSFVLSFSYSSSLVFTNLWVFEAILFMGSKLFFINFHLFDIFLFLTRSCVHTTENTVFRALKHVLLSFTISLKFWNGKLWTPWTRTLPEINFWSFNYNWINFQFFIDRIFGYRFFCCGFSIRRSFNWSPFHHSSLNYRFFNNYSMYYILPTR